MSKLTNKDNLKKLAQALDARSKAFVKSSVAEESARAQGIEADLQGQIEETQDMFGGKSIRYVTQAEYNQLTDVQKNDPTVAYFIVDSEDLSHTHVNKELLDKFGSRTLTIGNKGKTFDGSANVSWTLAEIGAAPSSHNHDDRYYTESEINTKVTSLQAEIDTDVKVETDRAKAAEAALQAAIDGKAGSVHTHDDRYFTETEINNKLAGYSATGHNHDDIYYTETEMDAKITTINNSIATAKSDAQKYADNQIAALVGSAPESLNTLQELSKAITDHEDIYDAYVVEMDSKLAGKSDTRHTHNYAGSSSAGGAATSANKVNQNLIVKLNGGSTEGTNLFTFNGSSAKTINITPSGIGAANSSHGTHVTYSTATPKANGTASVGSLGEIARADHIHPLQTTISGNAGSADKLFTARTITIGNKSNTFDGTANITYTLSDIGAAESGHTHNYAGSSSVGGAANSAVKLSSARTINGTSFDGSDNITTANWGTARNIYIADSDATNTGAAVSVNGSGNATLKLPATIKATLSGNASTATKLAATKTINGTNFDGSSNITTANWGTSRNLQIGLSSKAVNGSASVSWSLAEIGAEPLQKSVVSKTVSNGTLTLSTDRYQYATLSNGNTIALPSVSNFTEINLFVKDCNISNVYLPDNCKWRVDPNLNSGTSFMFKFIYTTQEWLAEVNIYS